MKMEWISVKDRLPDKEYLDCMLVLKVGDHYEIDCGGWTKAISWTADGRVETWGRWVNNDWDEGQGCVVQYWMPYPELPKEIKEKLMSEHDRWERDVEIAMDILDRRSHVMEETERKREDV